MIATKLKGKQKSVGKENQKVSKGEAGLGKKKNVVVPNYKRIMEKGKRIMVEDVELTQFATNGILGSTSLLNGGERASGVDNVGGNRDVRT
ncbi:hypothetical protein Tco_1488335, partial [Tanacetum coccineum]